MPPADEYEDQTSLGLEEPPPKQENPYAGDDTPDAADPKQYARAMQKRRFQLQELGKFWATTLETPLGRLAMWELLQSMHTFEQRFAATPGSGFPQPEATWFYMGERECGQRLNDTLQRHNYLGHYQMLKEHHPDFVERKPKRSKPDE